MPTFTRWMRDSVRGLAYHRTQRPRPSNRTWLTRTKRRQYPGHDFGRSCASWAVAARFFDRNQMSGRAALLRGCGSRRFRDHPPPDRLGLEGSSSHGSDRPGETATRPTKARPQWAGTPVLHVPKRPLSGHPLSRQRAALAAEASISPRVRCSARSISPSRFGAIGAAIWWPFCDGPRGRRRRPPREPCEQPFRRRSPNPPICPARTPLEGHQTASCCVLRPLPSVF